MKYRLLATTALLLDISLPALAQFSMPRVNRDSLQKLTEVDYAAMVHTTRIHSFPSTAKK